MEEKGWKQKIGGFVNKFKKNGKEEDAKVDGESDRLTSNPYEEKERNL
jgi:hypothetical protein